MGNGQSAISNRQSRRAFTLIEILVVCAILAIVLTMGVPLIRDTMVGGKGINRAVKDVQEACSHARAMAILQSQDMELRIRPADGVFEVGAASTPRLGSVDSPSVSGEAWRMEDSPPAAPSGGGGGFSVRLPEGVQIEGLGINGEDWTEDAVGRVRFFPNGTCDEMSLVLYSDKNERKNIWLEVVTALAEVESDPTKFRAR
jgi:prepilin-type N-terminal cleavage/methylation domain-containing protein